MRSVAVVNVNVDMLDEPRHIANTVVLLYVQVTVAVIYFVF